MQSVTNLDKRPAFKVSCPECKSENVTMLKHWNDPLPKGKPPAFDPTHQCNTCGHKWIYRSKGEKLRSFIDC